MKKIIPIPFLILLFLTGCSKKEENLDLPAVVPAPVSAATAPFEEKQEAKYVYPLAQKRDPFVPLVGGAQGAPMAAAGGEKKGAETGDFAHLELRGIVRDKTGKLAMIASSNGEAYTVKSGRIYDRKNRMVSGVTGIIKETSVILISQNKMIRELQLIKKEMETTR